MKNSGLASYEHSKLKQQYDKRNILGGGITLQEAATIVKEYYAFDGMQDISDSRIESPDYLTFEDFISYVLSERKKYQVQTTPPPIIFGVFVSNNLLVLRDGKIQLKKYEENAPTYNVPAEIRDYMTDNFKKLHGFSGLLNEKVEIKECNYYCFNQFVVGLVEPFETKERTIDPERLFARAIFNFDFDEAADVMLMSDFPESRDATVMLNLLESIRSLHQEINEDKTLKKAFYERNTFEVQIEPLLRKTSSDVDKERLSRLPQRFRMLKTKMDFVLDMANSIKSQISSPYLKAACIFLSNREDRQNLPYDEILLMEQLSIKDRFHFARKFLNRERYQQFKEKIKEQSLKSHKLESIMVFGKEIESEQVLQNYMDYTSDIETVALLSVYFKTLRFASNNRYQHFISVFKRMIDRLGKDRIRIEFQKKCQEIEKLFKGKYESSSMTYVFKCDNCGSALVQKNLLKSIDQKKKAYARFVKDDKKRLSQCTECMEFLPRCCICLMQITIKNPFIEYDPKRQKKFEPDEGVGPDVAIVWCQKCKHGGHYEHVVDWFTWETRCPVSDCDCMCSEKIQ